ncbi:MAG: NADH-quinone oxidoreductase subunit H [Planctomycetes bacterium]|nr:NADH-quinone oxidoreductase subunit H [Planctomycetota bacterium]
MREGLTNLLSGLPQWLQDIALPVLFGLIPAVIIVLGVVTPVGLVGIWGERRIAGKIQDRVGPDRVGISLGPIKSRLFGLGQSVADGVKLLGKEDFIPPGGLGLMFLCAPLVVFAGALALFAALPFGPALWAADPNLGIFYLLSVGALEVLGVLMAGWSSNNKWSLLGAMREVAQVISYEIPMAIAALCPVLLAGSMKMSSIVADQTNGLDLWGLHIAAPEATALGWNLFAAFPFNIIAFVVFYICALAALKRAPFDLPECESELVAGFLTEYSGMRWSLFFLGEYAAMWAMSGIATVLWLGGWTGPLHGFLAGVDVGPIPGGVFFGTLAFVVKTTILFLLMIQIRWTLPRLRLDQVMSLCYKYLIPAAMLCMLASGAAALLASGGAGS